MNAGPLEDSSWEMQTFEIQRQTRFIFVAFAGWAWSSWTHGLVCICEAHEYLSNQANFKVYFAILSTTKCKTILGMGGEGDQRQLLGRHHPHSRQLLEKERNGRRWERAWIIVAVPSSSGWQGQTFWKRNRELVGEGPRLLFAHLSLSPLSHTASLSISFFFKYFLLFIFYFAFSFLF